MNIVRTAKHHACLTSLILENKHAGTDLAVENRRMGKQGCLNMRGQMKSMYNQYIHVLLK